MDEAFDHIVIGAAIAGCLAANRLGRDRDRRRGKSDRYHWILQ